MSGLRRAIAIGASVAFHGGLAVAVAVLAREPLRRAFDPAGSVEVGVVYREPAPVLAPAEVPKDPAPLRPGRPGRPVSTPTPAPTPTSTPTAPAAEERGPEAAESAGEPPSAGLEVAAEGAGLAVPVGTGGGEIGAGAGPGGEGTSAGRGRDGTGGSGEGGEGGEGGQAPDASLLAEITRRLAAVASECYPRSAKRMRLQGTVRLRFCVGAGGEAREARVVEGSGQGLLDEAALGCVLPRAAPFPAVPVCLAVPVRFRLGP